METNSPSNPHSSSPASLSRFPSLSVSSAIAQAFLSAILESFLDTELQVSLPPPLCVSLMRAGLQVRMGVVQVLLLIIRQGLVHPEQCIPYLITISTDPEPSIRIKANQHLSEHSSRYGHFVQVCTPLVGFELLTCDL